MKMMKSRFHAGSESQLKVGGLVPKTPCRAHLNAVCRLFLGSGLKVMIVPAILGAHQHV